MAHSVEPPAYLGRDQELVAGPRMDNLLSVHAGTARPAAAARRPDDLPYIPVLAAFDHEENGSPVGHRRGRSAARHGAGALGVRPRRHATRTGRAPSPAPSASPPTPATPSTPTTRSGTTRRTTRAPNGGPILKVNVNQRYATDGRGRAVFAAACEKAGVPWQTFVSNNAMPCGTTIGPITAARHGIPTVDIGVAILSMHSARELCGADDPYLLARCMGGFFTG